MQWLRVSVVAMAGLACVPDVGAEGETGGSESSTGEIENAPTPVTAAESGSVSTTDASTSNATTFERPTREDTGTGPDGDTDDDASPMCTSTECTTTCMTTYEHDDACECDNEVYPLDYVRCDLGMPCGDDRLCILQSVRYGIPGIYVLEDESYRLEIDVLGDGRARAHESGWTQDCCGGAHANEFGTLFHPQAVVESGDQMWSECIRFGAPSFAEIPECLLPENMFAGSCEPPLTECPALPDEPGPERACSETCPMAGDYVCDERDGTGLCSNGCDAIDCGCEDDKPGVCDEQYGSTACGVGSDRDDC